MEPIPRRAFLTHLGVSGVLARLQERQREGFFQPMVRFQLEKELKEASFEAVSYDSRKLCLRFSRNPIGSITLSGSGGRVTASKKPAGPNTLGVIEVDTWKVVHTAALRGDVGQFSFFSDGERIYGQDSSTVSGQIIDHHYLFDLLSGRVEIREYPYDRQNSGSYWALSGDTLLARRNINGLASLARVEWPGFREHRSVPLGIDVWAPRFSSDRSTVIYVDNQWLICRRTDDLRELWRRQVDPGLIDMTAKLPLGAGIATARYAISAMATTVALAVRQPQIAGKPLRYFVEILNGATGQPTAKWERDNDGLMLSPDGKFAGIASLDGRSGQMEPTVHMFAIPSGTEVGSVVHNRVSSKERLGAMGFGSYSEFTPDGRYLITSANNTVKIWQAEYI